MHFVSATDYRYSDYSFQLLDEHVRKPKLKGDWWSRLRPVYLLALLLLFGFAFGWAFGGRIVHFLRVHSPLLIQGCMCNGENFCFKSVNESGGQQFGRPFDCSLYSELLRFELVGAPAIQPTTLMSKEVFATAVAAGEFEKLRTFVGNTRLVYPHAKIVVYNQGLSSEESEQAAGWCNVTVRSLQSDGVPVEGPPELRALLHTFLHYRSFLFAALPLQIREPMEDLAGGTSISGVVPLIVESGIAEKMVDAQNVFFPNIFTPALQSIRTVGFVVEDSQETRVLFKWLYLCLRTMECIAQLEGGRSPLDHVLRIARQLSVQQTAESTPVDQSGGEDFNRLLQTTRQKFSFVSNGQQSVRSADLLCNP